MVYLPPGASSLLPLKNGKKGKLMLSYNGFYGIGSEAKKLDLLDATQYATIMNEAAENAGRAKIYANPTEFGKGTDWQDVIFNNAEKLSHEFSIGGGNDRSNFYSSFGYFDQTGIVLGDISKYKRVNLRLNSDHKFWIF